MISKRILIINILISLLCIMLVGCDSTVAPSTESGGSSIQSGKDAPSAGTSTRLIAIKINNLKDFSISKGDKVTIAPDMDYQKLPNGKISVENSEGVTETTDAQDFYIAENISVIDITKDCISVPLSENKIVLVQSYEANDCGFIIVNS